MAKLTQKQIDAVAEALARKLRQFNPAFDAARFLAACGVQP